MKHLITMLFIIAIIIAITNAIKYTTPEIDTSTPTTTKDKQKQRLIEIFAINAHLLQENSNMIKEVTPNLNINPQ